MKTFDYSTVNLTYFLRNNFENAIDAQFLLFESIIFVLIGIHPTHNYAAEHLHRVQMLSPIKNIDSLYL